MEVFEFKIWNTKCWSKYVSSYNDIARTGERLSKIKQGVITVIQKSGKPKGSIENLRPITLLSILRKILVVSLKKYIIPKLDAKTPPSQAAHRQGQNTTRHGTTTTMYQNTTRTILAEKAAISKFIPYIP